MMQWAFQIVSRMAFFGKEEITALFDKAAQQVNVSWGRRLVYVQKCPLSPTCLLYYSSTQLGIYCFVSLSCSEAAIPVSLWAIYGPVGLEGEKRQCHRRLELKKSSSSKLFRGSTKRSLDHWYRESDANKWNYGISQKMSYRNGQSFLNFITSYLTDNTFLIFFYSATYQTLTRLSIRMEFRETT